MKVILSRKGFDSNYGGIPNPILNEQFKPLPIPYKFGDSTFKDIVFEKDKSVFDLLEKNEKRFRFHYNKKSERLSPEIKCHLDPYLQKSLLNNKDQKWGGAFGQAGTAQSHLRKQLSKDGVWEDDILFLFYGWFQEVTEEYSFIDKESYPNGFLAIYGYLYVDKVFDNINDNIFDKEYSWLKEHPHYKYKKEFGKNNAIYLAKETVLVEGKAYPGYGILNYNEENILTRKGANDRREWKLPIFFNNKYGVKLSYNKNDYYWKYYNSFSCLGIHRGQEFVCDAQGNAENEKELKNWAQNLITNHRQKRK